MSFQYNIKAIPTMYNGVQFRSRLEARWAAYFDLESLVWKYEPFDLNGYIPDFTVQHPYLFSGQETLVEVKPILIAPEILAGETPRERAQYVINLAKECVNIGREIENSGWKGPYIIAGRNGKLCLNENFLIIEKEEVWKEAGNRVQWRPR